MINEMRYGADKEGRGNESDGGQKKKGSVGEEIKGNRKKAGDD